MFSTIQRSYGKVGVRFVLGVLGALALTSQVLFAANLTWTNTASGKWETGGNWSGGTAPTGADTAILTNNGPYTVTVDDTTISSAKTNAAFIWVKGATVGPQLVFNFGSGTFENSGYIILGNNGAGTSAGSGTMILSNGTVKIDTISYVGYASGSQGAVNLYGGSLSSPSVYLGDSSGTGTVFISGGATLTAGTEVTIGGGADGPGGFGTMTLSNATVKTPIFSVGGRYNGGNGGVGTLTVQGGANVIQGNGGTVAFHVGENLGGLGSMVMQGGTLLITNTSAGVVIGNGNNTLGSATGTLTINGGELDISQGLLQIGGAYNGSRGTGYFFMNGGTLNVNGSGLIVAYNGGDATMIMSNGVINTPEFAVGGNGNGHDPTTTLKMYGGTLKVGATGLYFDYQVGASGGSSTYLIAGGTLLATNAATAASIIGQSSPATTVTQSNGTVNARNLEFAVGGKAVWDIYGGTLIATNAINLGYSGNGTGTVLIANGGVLEIQKSTTVTLGAADQSAGYITNQNGGTVRFDGTANVTFNKGAFVVTNATVEYKDNSSLTMPSIIAYQGTNTLRLNNSTDTGDTGAMTLDTTQHFTTMALVNGSAGWKGNLTVGSGGTLSLANTAATFSGLLTNNGVFTSVNSTATFSQKVVNNGAWITDPSTNTYLSDNTQGSSGSLSMAAGDVYIFKSNFVNQSTQNTTYNTLAGKFLFNGVALTQTFASAAADLGPGGIYSSYPDRTNTLDGTLWGTGPTANNFGLGTLEIGPGSTVEVANATANLRGALYLENLFIDAGGLLIVSNNVSVYFMGANGWSFANNVALLTGAELHELVPEPSLLLLLASGLVTLVWARRRAKA